MSILFGSRYILSNVVELTSVSTLPGFVTVLDRFHFDVNSLRGFSYRSMREGIDLDLLAFDIMGREGLWFYIADVNDILDPFEPIEAGRQLVIPTRDSFDVITSLLNKNA